MITWPDSKIEALMGNHRSFHVTNILSLSQQDGCSYLVSPGQYLFFNLLNDLSP